MGVRIKNMTSGTPSDSDSLVFDSVGGTKRVTLATLKNLLGVTWGHIQGVLAEQTDLMQELNTKIGTNDEATNEDIDEILNS